MEHNKMSPRWALALAAALTVQIAQAQTQTQTPAQKQAAEKSADERAAKAVSQMTIDEKIQTVFGYFSTDFKGVARPKEGVPQAAGFLYGVQRLGIPHQQLTDAGVGVATQRGDKLRERTALPSGMATTATWNPLLAYQGGAMIGKEARLSGHNVLLAGGVNLVREPRNGRNFEYGGEDPLLAGIMVGEQIRGAQSNNIISTIKHFAFNDQETGRFYHDTKIGEQAARQSDLLAFQIAMERGDPGSVMCSYNRVRGDYACENDWLLNKVLKKDWGFKGYVMSDWGATHSTIPAANRGLDQQSGWPFDQSPYFQGALKEAVQNKHVSQKRFDDMVHRILRTMYKHGLMEHPVQVEDDKIDYTAHAKVTQGDAEEGIVLLKNDKGVLPLSGSYKTIAIIGGHADKGVLSGGGSSQVYPRGGLAVPNEGPNEFPGPMVFFPSSPLKHLQERLQNTKFVYHDGKDPAAAAKVAAQADVALVFAHQWTAESVDVPNLSLPNNQDALVAAVGAANPRTVAVLQTGGAVTMPWLNNVAAVVEAWYPGTEGGLAIARVLSGEVDATGRLPITFPASESQLPRPKLDGLDLPKDAPFTVDYDIDGAAVGYKWFEKKGLKPLFAFGHGLSYTQFSYTDLKAAPKDGSIAVSFSTANSGKRDGKAVPQVYVSKSGSGWEAPKRLGGWDKVTLKAGESRASTVTVDPRTLAVFDVKSNKWKIAAGEYTVTLAEASDKPVTSVKVRLPAREFAAGGR